jgi:NADH-quinone oxidoreductase subunit N
MATIVKATAIIAFVVLFHSQFKALGYAWELLLTFVLISTLFVGNITAVFQRSVKRMLAYSSIAQVGFMLFALYGPNNFANEGILLYIMAYSIASIGLFGVLIKMKDYSFEAFNGLAKKEPLLAGMTTLFLMSLAGIPLTGGFFAKYYMLNAAVQSGIGLWLVVVAILFAAISIYYYFKLIQAMYFAEGEPAIQEMGQSYKYKLLVFAILILGLGILPNVFLSYLYF